jgi:hypothetical protein
VPHWSAARVHPASIDVIAEMSVTVANNVNSMWPMPGPRLVLTGPPVSGSLGGVKACSLSTTRPIRPMANQASAWDGEIGSMPSDQALGRGPLTS